MSDPSVSPADTIRHTFDRLLAQDSWERPHVEAANAALDVLLSDRAELWERREVVTPGTSSFRWLVWTPDGTLGGNCAWYATEDEARAHFDRLRAAGEGDARGSHD